MIIIKIIIRYFIQIDVCDNAAMKRCPAQYWKKKKKKSDTLMISPQRVYRLVTTRRSCDCFVTSSFKFCIAGSFC